MINNLLRGFIYFVVFVLIQVLVLNNIHFLRIATPFLYSDTDFNRSCFRFVQTAD